jgi:hypothetical protein
MTEIINLVIGFLAGIITILCITWIIIPLFDALLYGVGYIIFNILCTNRKKAMNAPFRYAMTVFKWFIIGFGERLVYGTTGTHTIGNKRWRPYFHYK